MSVSREVIADAIGIPPEVVACKNCYRSERPAVTMYCEGWVQPINEDNFCSFFYPKKRIDEKEALK